jgi:hypothetical protein
MKTFVAGLLLALALAPAFAGRTCEAQAPQAAKVQRAIELADRTRQALDASGAEVVALARIGQDLSKYGLTWSHFGWAYRDEGGRWRVVHKLNQCGSANSALYRQGLGEFFLDDMVRFEAGLVVMQPEVQAHLLALLRDDRRVLQLDTPAYSMLAYPWSTRYQQSNQWAIETLALAQESAVVSRERAQAWLQFQGYVPTTLRLDAFTRLGARITAANIAFDDHPNEKRFSDRIETVTVDSVFAWLQRSGLAGAVQVVR